MTLAGRFIIDRTGDERIAAQSVEDCMTILDELNLQAAIEDPELVVVGHRESGAALTFGLGLNESVLCWQGASGDPPYLSTRGDDTREGTTRFLFDQVPADIQNNHLIAMSLARSAVLYFLQTGRPDPAVQWGED